jgi:hypothetical protein
MTASFLRVAYIVLLFADDEIDKQLSTISILPIASVSAEKAPS